MSKLKQGGDIQVSMAVSCDTLTTRGGAGVAGARGVVYQDFNVISWDADTMTEQSDVMLKLKSIDCE